MDDIAFFGMGQSWGLALRSQGQGNWKLIQFGNWIIKALEMTETPPPAVLTRALFVHTLSTHKQWTTWSRQKHRHCLKTQIYDDLHAPTTARLSTSGRTVIEKECNVRGLACGVLYFASPATLS